MTEEEINSPVDPYDKANYLSRVTLFTLLSHGVVEKEKQMWLRFLKIWYSVLISTSPIAVLLLAAIFPLLGVGHFPPKPGNGIGLIVFFYLFSLLCLVLGYYWRRIIKDHYLYGGFLGTFLSCYLRPFCFEFGIIIAFVMGVSGFTWFAGAPLLLIEGIALVLAFPTRKKWEKWLAEPS